jgi:hypothetical protein
MEHDVRTTMASARRAAAQPWHGHSSGADRHDGVRSPGRRQVEQ